MTMYVQRACRNILNKKITPTLKKANVFAVFAERIESQALQRSCEKDIEKHCRRCIGPFPEVLVRSQSGLSGTPSMRSLTKLRKYWFHALFFMLIFVMVFQFSADLCVLPLLLLLYHLIQKAANNSSIQDEREKCDKSDDHRGNSDL